MTNILLPSMGTSEFFKDSYFPKPLTEIKGKTMLELMTANYKSIEEKNYIYIFPEQDCAQFHLDASAKLLQPGCTVIKLRNQTKGALCTSLMAIDYINNSDRLVIANADQIIDVDYETVFRYFDSIGADAGVITFPNIHPRFSYARVQGDMVVEVAEKRPLSKRAIAGFYYYKKGSDFIAAAQKALLKRNEVNGNYYLSASINELILTGKRVGHYDIEGEAYHSFYSPTKIKEYEEKLK